jgi:HPt (histidine-containing phosphotransfer) domain-containing protein
MSGVDPELAAVWERMRPVAAERAARLVEACDGRVPAEAARRDAHKLAGSLGMYGLEDAGRLAIEADRMVAAGALSEDGARAELREVAVALAAAIGDAR